ncbi:hypothetical protein M5689_012326 [Euphorbia peplus]|nr:hypothetical protein M5689_012326 [Euphorbia peplus]
MSPKVISENGFVNGSHLATCSFEETCLIVGRNSGFVLRHANATLTMFITPSAVLLQGDWRRWSITSFNNICWPVGANDEDDGTSFSKACWQIGDEDEDDCRYLQIIYTINWN